MRRKQRKVSLLRKKLKRTRTKKNKKSIQAKINLLNQKKSDTKPELLTGKILDRLGLSYIKQFPLQGFFYDFYIPDQRLIIEVQGDYFHSSPLKYKKTEWNTMQKKNHKRDKIKMSVALGHGYRIIYIWEGDLKKGKLVTDRLQEFVAQEKPEMTKHLLEDIYPQYENFYYQKKKE